MQICVCGFMCSLWSGIVSQVTEQISLYIARSSLTTPCVQCGKSLSYPCYKSLLEPMSKGKFVSATSFRTREKLPTSPLTLVDTTLLARWHNWIFLVRLVPWECCKTPYVAQFPVICVFRLFLEVQLDNFHTREWWKSSLFYKKTMGGCIHHARLYSRSMDCQNLTCRKPSATATPS
jgi:hypothetical protein